MSLTVSMPPSIQVLRLLAELKTAYSGFTWESALWPEVRHRRSPYRTLVLFGLSARTRDALLVEMCREFFRTLPRATDLAEAGNEAGSKVGHTVRPGQLPFVASMAVALADGVPRDRDGLLAIKGVGGKIAECVLAYGWEEDALPLDANCVRVLERVFGLEYGRRDPAPLREGLKCVYLKQSNSFADLSIRMVEVHEILRLHGQVCCTRTPDCGSCPVSGCSSRREPWDQAREIGVDVGIWDEWRELINEPIAI